MYCYECSIRLQCWIRSRVHSIFLLVVIVISSFKIKNMSNVMRFWCCQCFIFVFFDLMLLCWIWCCVHVVWVLSACCWKCLTNYLNYIDWVVFLALNFVFRNKLTWKCSCIDIFRWWYWSNISKLYCIQAGTENLYSMDQK